jgi:hypothetical protein
MADPIGITFMPSQDNQDQGGRNMGLDGPGGADLSQAIKILSLRLPRVQGAQALAPASLLNGQGAGNTGGLNPHAAVFEALLRAILGAGGPGITDPTGRTLDNGSGNIFRPGVPGGSLGDGNRTPDPRITPGGDDGGGLTRPGGPRVVPGDEDKGPSASDMGGGLLAPTFNNPRDNSAVRFRRDTGY